MQLTCDDMQHAIQQGLKYQVQRQRCCQNEEPCRSAKEIVFQQQGLAPFGPRLANFPQSRLQGDCDREAQALSTSIF
jgi:hypothetical protein